MGEQIRQLTEDYAQGNVSRRELVQRMLLLTAGAAGAAAVGGGSASAEETTTPRLSDECRKVLIERICNARYDVDENGKVIVQYNDGVWPGYIVGGAQHQDWLLNPDQGLKGNPQAALSQDLNDPGIPDHAGADPGPDAAAAIGDIFAKAAQLGVMDEANLIYFVLKRKMDTDYHGALQKSIDDFANFITERQDVDAETKGRIQALIREFNSRPVAMVYHSDY